MKTMKIKLSLVIVSVCLQGCLLGADAPLDEEIPMAEASAEEASISDCEDGHLEELNGLCWRSEVDVEIKMEVDDAQNYCQSLSGGGWRLPTAWEFGTILGGCSLSPLGFERNMWVCTTCENSEVCEPIFSEAIEYHSQSDPNSDLEYITAEGLCVNFEENNSSNYSYMSYDFCYSSKQSVVCVK